jgi:hypothetical protein
VLVPEGVCVATDLHAGIGGLELFDRNTGGVDVDRVDDGRAPAGMPRLVVRGEVGMGYFEIDHEDDNDGWDDDWRREWRDHDGGSDTDNACIGDGGAQG